MLRHDGGLTKVETAFRLKGSRSSRLCLALSTFSHMTDRSLFSPILPPIFRSRTLAAPRSSSRRWAFRALTSRCAWTTACSICAPPPTRLSLGCRARSATYSGQTCSDRVRRRIPPGCYSPKAPSLRARLEQGAFLVVTTHRPPRARTLRQERWRRKFGSPSLATTTCTGMTLLPSP